MRALFPLDGSQETWTAVERGLAMLTDVPGLRVTFLNVRHAGFENAVDPELVEETFEKDEDDEIFPTEASSRRVLDRAAALATERGLVAETVSVEGRPTEQILALAAEHDVLVMHGLGRSSLRDTLKGSSSEAIVRKAPCSVLLVRT